MINVLEALIMAYVMCHMHYHFRFKDISGGCFQYVV